MEDDSEADVEDEEDEADNNGNPSKSSSQGNQDSESSHVEDEENITESNVCCKQFVLLNSCSMNFEAGKD